MRRICINLKTRDKWLRKNVEWITCKECQRSSNSRKCGRRSKKLTRRWT